jgi:hypothetical protein
MSAIITAASARLGRQPSDRDGTAGKRGENIVDGPAALKEHEEHVAGDRWYHHHRHQHDGIEQPLTAKFASEQQSEP